MRLALLFVLLASCSSQPHTGSAAAALTSARFDPAAYGGQPNDGIDDRPALQAAIDAATSSGVPSTVVIGPGRWTLTRSAVGAYNRFAALSTHGNNLTIRCEDAVLDLVGDQGASSTILLSIDAGAENVRVTGCTFDSATATNTVEQTHAIATTGTCSGSTCRPIRNIEIDHNRFIWPKRGDERKGDCVRLLGNAAPSGTDPGTELWGIRVHDNSGDCARSFVEIQRGVHDLSVASNTITCTTCDQDVDGEATGVIGEAGRPTGIVIVGNTFTDAPATQGDASVSLTSVTGAVIADNTMGRGIASYRSSDVVISGNTITALATTSERGVIDVANACEGLTITGNVIRRGGHAGPVIVLAPHSGATCSGALISGNALTQGTAAAAIALESSSGTVVADNRISYAAAAPGFGAVQARSVVAGAAIAGLAIHGNLITGSVSYGVRLQAYPGSFGPGISVTGNTAVGPPVGLFCEDANFTVPIVASGNSWMAGVWPGATISAGVP